MATQETLLERLLTHADRRGDDVFASFFEEETALGYRDLLERAARFARSLAEAGVAPREHLFVLAPLGPDILAAFLGAMLHRAIPALLSYPSSKVAPEVYAKNLRGVLDTTGARTVLTARSLEGALRAALGADSGRKILFLDEHAGDAPVDRDGVARAVSEIPADEVAFLQHSSGSTGLQKGVALSHRAVLNQARHYAKAIALDPARDRVASWLPLYHDMGLIATFLVPLVTGTPVVFMDPFRWALDPAILLEAIDRSRATLVWLPNFAYVHLAKRAPLERTERLDLSCVRGFVNCSEPVRASSHRTFLERFERNGVREDMLWTCYAMAENTFAVTHAGGGAIASWIDWIDPRALASARRAEPVREGEGTPVVSCGPPIEGTEVLVVDEDRREVPERTIGEIALRSDSMLTEYHKNPEATAKALAGGFYFTGDLGYLASGHVFVTGRKKDLIIVGGRNFYPQDLEDVASQMAGVIPGRTAALGVEDPESGTEAVVLIAETELEDQAARPALARAIQRAALERLDCSVRVELVPRGWIVKTSSGKVARKTNLEKYLAARPRPTNGAEPPASEPPIAPEPLALLVVKVLLAALVLALALILRPDESLILYRGF